MSAETLYKSAQHEELVLTIRSRVGSGERYLHIANECAANGFKVSAALVRKVYLFGVDSKKMRKALGIKPRQRDRLIINGCPPELKSRFTALCNEHSMTRLEMFTELVTFYELEE